MNITIAGGGNIGMLFAVHCAAKGHNVIVYTSKFNQYEKNLFVVNENNEEVLAGEINCATYNPEEAFSNADLILVTVPPFCIDEILPHIQSYAKKNPPIGFIPGTGGVEYAFSKYKGEIFGLQRVPAVARIKLLGKTVCASGYRKELFLGAMNNNHVEKYCNFITETFEIPCHSVSNYLNITLTPSNPILHTTRLFSMFKDYDTNTTYSKIPLFYEEWTEEASKFLFACDDELQKICKAYNLLDLSMVKSLKIHYESQTLTELTTKIRNINSLKKILTPMIKVKVGYIPDFNSRYFISDFPYGLYIIKQVGDFAGCSSPTIDMIWEWYQKLHPETKRFEFSRYGITSAQDVINFDKFENSV